MTVATEALDAWCPPTLSPSRLGRRWLALWIIHEESHSTLRSSALSSVRRSGSASGGSMAGATEGAAREGGAAIPASGMGRYGTHYRQDRATRRTSLAGRLASRGSEAQAIRSW